MTSYRGKRKIASYGRVVDVDEGFRQARALLTHRPRRKGQPYPDTDAWRLARAQWHWDFGNRAYAERELKDINMFRASRNHDEPGKWPPLELRR